MRTRTALTAALTAAALAAGCGSSSSSPASSTQPPTSSTGQSGGTTGSSGGTTGGGSATGTIPTKTSQKPEPTKMGTTIVITPTGFSPQVLIAPLGLAITWENESGKVQSVHLDNFGSTVDSGAIQPGHAWKFNPRTASSIVYHSTYDPSFKAQLQVQAVGNS
jgi:hypothetical protein